MIFVGLILLVIVLSHVFYLAGTSVTFDQAYVSEQVTPSGEELVGDEALQSEDPQVEQVTVDVESLLSADGIRFLFTSTIRNFMGFGPVGVILVAMIGVGLAEQAGLVTRADQADRQLAPALVTDLHHRGRRRAVSALPRTPATSC